MPAFLVDAMLGSIARKLRLFGFDTLYMLDTSDSDILKIAAAEDRVILTCDTELFKRIVKAGANGVLLEHSDDLENIVHTLSKYGIRSLCFNILQSRCSVCNGLLLKKSPTDIKGAISTSIVKRHTEFFKCANCNKIYWEGSHISRIRSLATKIDNKIKKVRKVHIKSSATRR